MPNRYSSRMSAAAIVAAASRVPIIGARGIVMKSKAEANRSFALESLRQAGKIRDWDYEPASLVIARVGKKVVRYTPDFSVTHLDDSVEMEEVKGFMREAARVRLVTAAKAWPCFRWTILWLRAGALIPERVL